MAKGEHFAPEWSTFHDSKTGVEVRQLTNYKGHSHHLYFTNSGWYANGQKLLFGSDRNNSTNLYSVDLRSGEIEQLTDVEQLPSLKDISFQNSCVNPHRDEVYFNYNHSIIALDLQTLEERTLYSIPQGYKDGMLNVTADGKYLCTVISVDLSATLPIDLGRGYVGFQEYWQAKPHSQILRIDTERGGAEIMFEEDYWIGHVNTSPTLAHIITYCHEGPWHMVDHRMWGLDLATGKTWKLRPSDSGERVGHEYWFADGEYVGYEGYYPEGGTFYGCIRYDNTGLVEAPFEQGSMHFHSNDLSLIVGDGFFNNPHMFLWRFKDGHFEGPRTVLHHRGSFHIQKLHVHPRMSADGKQVVFSSDLSGYGNVHLITLPDFDSLSNHV